MKNMIIKKENRVRHENSPNCIVHEYPLGDKNIDVAIAQINGRYPDKGFATNEEVNEIIYVVKGVGKVVIDGKEHKLSDGDALLIRSKQKYFFEGELKLVISCNPAWYLKQYKTIE